MFTPREVVNGIELINSKNAMSRRTEPHKATLSLLSQPLHPFLNAAVKVAVPPMASLISDTFELSASFQ